MGVYLNPGNKKYRELLASSVVVDKSLMIDKTSRIMNTTGKYLCVSRPRRFGKVRMPICLWLITQRDVIHMTCLILLRFQVRKIMKFI